MRVTWIVGVGFAILLAAACGGIGASSGSGGFLEPAPDTGHGHGAWVSVGDAAGDARGAPSPEAGVPAPLWTPPDAGAPPVVPCGAGAIDSGGVDADTGDGAAFDAAGPDAAAEGGALCALPAPYCLAGWIVSYSGGSCQNGLCAFTQQVTNCYGSCDKGRCYVVAPSE